MKPQVSVIVPFRDAGPRLPTVVHALKSQTIPQDVFEVIWVDDASRDGGGQWLQGQLLATWRLLVMREPRGSYAARNCGLQAAVSDNLAFTDADCRPQADWLEKGLAALATAPRVAGRIELDLSESPSLAELVDADRFLRQRHYVQEGFAATANLFVRSTVFTKVGHFIEDLQSGGDQEFGWRCSQAGIPIEYAEGAAVSHAARASLRELLRKGERVGFGSGQVLRRGGMPVSTIARRAAERFTVARRRSLGERCVPRVPWTRTCLLTAVHLLVFLANAAGGLRGVLSPRAAGFSPSEPDGHKR